MLGDDSLFEKLTKIQTADFFYSSLYPYGKEIFFMTIIR